MSQNRYDVILVGGGLQSGLIAAAISHQCPGRSILIIERDERIGGNHTWSFHPNDVPENAQPWVNGLVSHRWDSYEVRLGGFNRRLKLAYASITSEDFADRIASLQNVKILLSTNVDTITSDQAENSVETSAGDLYRAGLVIDNRGPQPHSEDSRTQCGFQKFVGIEIETGGDWPLANPVIMDDSVDQSDGFRFFYTLPFTRRRILVEDTRFSDSPDLDRLECIETTRAYLNSLGVTDFRIVREETGVLPMPFGSIDLPRATNPLAGGYAGGWFHAATGYSFPMAVAFATVIATQVKKNDAAGAVAAIGDLAKMNRGRAYFARFLNRLLFRLVAPRKRYQIFRRFYRVLTEQRIARFYSHHFTAGDAFRIVVGFPPGGLRPIRFFNSFRGQVSTSSESNSRPIKPSSHSIEGVR